MMPLVEIAPRTPAAPPGANPSAALKLLAEESHSRAFAAFYDKSAGASWVSSALLRVEVIRAVTRVSQ